MLIDSCAALKLARQTNYLNPLSHSFSFWYYLIERKMGWVLNATPKVDAQSEYPTIIAICVVLSVLSTAVVGTRLYIRHSKRGLASDDWMAGLSMVFALLYSGLCIARASVGRHETWIGYTD